VHKTITQFPDIKSFEYTTVLTLALHNIYQSKQSYAFVYLRNYSHSYSA